MSQASVLRSPAFACEFAAPQFVCSWETGGWGAAWVQVAGELDLATSSQFRETLAEAQRAARLVVLDLRELSFIDCSGTHVILDAARDLRQNGGRLLIVRGTPQVDRVLALTEVSKQVTIFDHAPNEPPPVLAHLLPPTVAA